MEILIGTVSFLGGMVTSGLLFMFAFTGRLTKVETTLADLCDKVNKQTQAQCPLHGEIDKRLALAELEIKRA